jgi:flagellar motor switch/type III secretory pathway protein FliN
LDEQRSGYDSRPIPDPTLLTTEALQREVATLRELIEQRLDALAQVQDQIISRVEAQADGHRALDDERFMGIDQQFQLVEQQRIEQKGDTKAAVDAALTAQKEAGASQTAASEQAITKLESASTKQLEQLTSTFNTEVGAIRREIGDFKDRITVIEALKLGAQEQKEGLSTSAGITIAAASFVVAAIAVAASII